jgi:hypothetical protein
MDTRIKKGQHLSRATEFQKGQHWRTRKPYWDREWLRVEYEDKKKSAAEIAAQFGITENAILFWLAKHKIPTRTMTEVRAVKKWTTPRGAGNPMYGKRGILNKNWKGGLTPLRQRIYAKAEWGEFARQVFARDRCCRLCESKEKMEIHHIDPFSQSPLLVMDIGNVLVLCRKCHKMIQGKERKWKRKLYQLIERG